MLLLKWKRVQIYSHWNLRLVEALLIKMGMGVYVVGVYVMPETHRIIIQYSTTTKVNVKARQRKREAADIAWNLQDGLGCLFAEMRQFCIKSDGQ